ncbi:MAG: OmpA family protein [Elusimicrobiaceae bacterium]|nr:OmpA family protein [Elusimicrobiaceae bacterium]
MKKVALLCVAALCLAACHCERKTTGTPCRKAACKCKHAQVKKECKCHQVHMGPLQQACNCTTTCVAPKPKPAPMKMAPAPKPQPTATQRAAEQSAALSTLGTVKAKDNKLSLAYKEPIRFGHNSAVIETPSYSELDATAAVLKKYPNAKVTVNGYTDSLGNPAYNVDLSQRRAQAVADALVQRGVKAENVSAVGHGAANPVATNSTAEGRRMNRRVELEIENK